MCSINSLAKSYFGMVSALAVTKKIYWKIWGRGNEIMQLTLFACDFVNLFGSIVMLINHASQSWVTLTLKVTEFNLRGQKVKDERGR